MRWSLLIFLVLMLAACRPTASDAIHSAPPDRQVVTTGAEVLASSGFAMLQGRRVGLIVNHTAMVGETHLADLMHEADGVELIALFGPEHGIRGTADAGARVGDGMDPRTGVPIYSLYGETRKPTQAMLENVDALVFDIQDVGARFYTYISTMGLAMQAAAENDIDFFVLDRPNPLGGNYVSGFVLEPEFESFVGQFPIPTTHGLTVGELAAMIVGEQLMSGLDGLRLEVLDMRGWERDMLWADTGLDWLPPSPNIPDVETALVYAGTCLFEAAEASEGRGTYEPFKLIGAPFGSSEAYAEHLNELALPGVRFLPESFTPVSIPGMSMSPKLQDTPLEGVRIEVVDETTFAPVETGIHVLYAFFEAAPDEEALA
ncbi:MAG: exo-beta-N-acetylmuramidase NamZ domain-containing protein, partial [Rhodothermales bacterium]